MAHTDDRQGTIAGAVANDHHRPKTQTFKAVEHAFHRVDKSGERAPGTQMQTQRLLLRPFTLDDAEAYWPLVSLPEVLRYTGEQPQTSLDEVRQTLISRPLRDYAVYGFGRMACIEKASGRLVGFCGLKYLEDLKDVDIGYRFTPDCWGKGYATESARAIMETAADYGIARVIGLVEPENTASAGVLEKLELVFEAHVQPEGCSKILTQYATPDTGPANSFHPTPLPVRHNVGSKE